MKVSKLKKEQDCLKIFETLKRDPFIRYDTIHENTGVSKNAIFKYLREMSSQGIIKGPYLHLKPSVNYPRYIQMATFSSPWRIFESLKGFPCICYHALCLGDWNFLFMTERALDFSKLVGYSQTHVCEKRGPVWDVPPQSCTWDDAFNRLQESLDTVPRSTIPSGRQVEISWSKNEWTLYEVLKDNLRQTITPIIRKMGALYDTYTEWKKTLPQYTQVITAYYPEGFSSQIQVFFLVEPKKLAHIPSLFRYWPATTVFYRAGDKLLILLALQNKEYVSETLNLFEELVSRGYISSFKYALLLRQWRHK